MDYEVGFFDTQEILTVVVRDTIPQNQISARVIQLFDQVYAFLPTAGITHPGLNIILYRSGCIDLEAGVQVPEAFQGSDTVHCSSLPAGRTVHTTHFGPYSGLGEAHQVVQDWCRQRGLKTSEISWEIYGHWNDDPALLRTDIYYLLVEASPRSPDKADLPNS